jgi:hypothetical protein
MEGKKGLTRGTEKRRKREKSRKLPIFLSLLCIVFPSVSPFLLFFFF